MKIIVTCERRGCQGITHTDLTDGGDPDLPAVVPPPAGWISSEDPDAYICGDCATPEEISDHMADMAFIEKAGLWDQP